MDGILRKLKNGELKLHELEKTMLPAEAARVRRKFLEELLGKKFDHVSRYTIDPAALVGKNIENFVGAVQVPLGVAGPLKVNGGFAKGEYYVPLATTEGALVASINRGMSAVTKSGGATVRVLKDQMTRAPAFECRDLNHSMEFISWSERHFQDVKQVAESTTRFGKLQSITPYVLGKNVFLRFSYSSGDAAGLNMVTVATDAAVRFIEQQTGVACVALSSNMCADKKSSAMDLIQGRGKTVTAEISVPSSLVEQVFKTTPEAMVKVNYKKNYLGSALAGNLGGFNAHVANPVAAVFIACGQDPAEVVESSMAITSLEVTKDGDLSASILMPSLEVGTVGGGTSVATQNECLQLLGCAGAGDPPGTNSKKFAEIIAATALAGELSLLAAFATGTLASTHEKLGRKKK